MILKDISFEAPEENIYFDDVLLHIAEKEAGKEVLRFWESPMDFIVLGRIGKEEDDVNSVEAGRNGIPVLRRASGGGTVVQGVGCLNFSLILSKATNPALADLRQSYVFILEKVIKALKQSGVEAEFHPISDIALKGSLKKISGNAQKRGRQFIMHHGTILYNFDLQKIARYLHMPKDTPDYRKGRSHLDFVANAPLDVISFKSALRQEFGVTDENIPLNEDEERHLSRIITEGKLK